MGRAVPARARFYYLDEVARPAAGRVGDFGGLVLGHGLGRTARLARREVDELDHVPADEIVYLGSADGAAERALYHHQRALAEEGSDLLEELVGVDRAEVLELHRADLRIDPFLCLAGHGLHRVLVPLDGGEPLFKALLNVVGGRGADTRLALVVELIELVLDLRLGPAADRGPVARAALLSRALLDRRSSE